MENLFWLNLLSWKWSGEEDADAVNQHNLTTAEFLDAMPDEELDKITSVELFFDFD